MDFETCTVRDYTLLFTYAFNTEHGGYSGGVCAVGKYEADIYCRPENTPYPD
jgi:hypothetical protein